MFETLDRFYKFTQRHRYLYPLFLLVKLVLYLIPLVQHEGLFGAARFLVYRLKFAVRNRGLLNNARLPDQPIEVFRSRHGFQLTCWIQYVIYDEIFLERVYEFAALRQGIPPLSGGVVLDFGTHHGMFINFVQTLNRNLEFFGAELTPQNYAAARARFEPKDRVTLVNAGIGGKARKISIKLVPVSSSQSMYSTEGEGSVEANIITPADFAAANGLQNREIALFKMDIEGAENEVFENFDCVREILKATRFFVIEIHDAASVPAITSRLESVGFTLQERRGINFLYAKNNS